MLHENGQISKWLDLKVFYIKMMGKNTPNFLTVNHMPLSDDILLEVNCVRADEVCTILKRDRVDTFVNTDSIRMTGSVKFEVFNEEEQVVVLSGKLELLSCGKNWIMNCEMGVPGPGFELEVYVTACFSGRPIVFTETLQLRKALAPIPEYEMKMDHSFQKYLQTRQYIEEEEGDSELSWFNAGVRVGIGIGLSICLGVGLLVRTYHGTRRRIL